jgi:ABC-type lipoprotein export system ATPase subunit
VAIARAIAGEPKLLLADEPTGNLDTHMAHQVMDLLEEIHAGGATIVMVTHDPLLAARAGRNIQLADGCALAAEDVDTLIELPRMYGQGAAQPLAARA